jgi:hypothetical protein
MTEVISGLEMEELTFGTSFSTITLIYWKGKSIPSNKATNIAIRKAN